MTTKLIRGLYNCTFSHQGGVITIGNFDGVHLGHQELIAQVIKKAKELNVPSIVVTFEPHPFEFFSHNELHIPRITRLREKFTDLASTGVDYVLILPFNQKLAKTPAYSFIADVLFAHLKPQAMIVGDDFHFGYQRQGDFSFLRKMGAELGFDVSTMPTFHLDGERVSSTRVRNALGQGDLTLATQLLGHAYSMQGRIRPGDQLGRRLGFPTANIYLHRKLTPVKGIFTVFMHGILAHPIPGVANVGTRPTLDGTRTLLEVHLLDFNQELYGRYVKVEFCKKLRDEERFSSLIELQEHIAKDVVEARKYFKNMV